MKTLLTAALFLSISPAFASGDTLCVTKQENAASFKLAQEMGVSVQGVQVMAFDYGMWTEMPGSNSGSDKVTVRASNLIDRGMTVKHYDVSAKQIGATADCNIVSVVEARN